MYIKFFILALALVGVVRGDCYPRDAKDWNDDQLPTTMWDFGLKEGGGTPLYRWGLYRAYFTYPGADYYLEYDQGSPILYETYWMINQSPLVGGHNFTYYNNQFDPNSFVPTANFTCGTASSVLWGPAYPDVQRDDGNLRGRYTNLETYVHYSAPNVNGSISKICAKINIQDFTYNLKPETSYIRSIVFVKNTGTKAERVRLHSFTWTEYFCTDRSPYSANGRYFTCHMFPEGDLGQNGDGYFDYNPGSVHVRGPKGRDQTAQVWAEYYEDTLNTNYLTVLAPGEQMAFMIFYAQGQNITSAMNIAAEIDAEPAQIFHDLTADQLAMIRNWGGCQAVIGPTATVTITPPSQCSNGLTSDFTVQASSTRTDLTAGFTHRVIGIQGIEMVPPQSSTTLSVPNGVGQVTHQLWYKECLVKETAFDSCARA